MAWMLDKIKNSQTLSAAISTLISLGMFSVQIWNNLTNGALDGTQLHNLLTTANASQMVLLFAVMIGLKLKS